MVAACVQATAGTSEMRRRRMRARRVFIAERARRDGMVRKSGGSPICRAASFLGPCVGSGRACVSVAAGRRGGSRRLAESGERGEGGVARGAERARARAARGRVGSSSGRASTTVGAPSPALGVLFVCFSAVFFFAAAAHPRPKLEATHDTQNVSATRRVEEGARGKCVGECATREQLLSRRTCSERTDGAADKQARSSGE